MRDDDYEDEQEAPAREPMRPVGLGTSRRRPSTDDIKARRRMRRAAAAAQEERAVTTPRTRGEILRAIAAAPTLQEQADLVRLLDEATLEQRRLAALDRETDWARTTVGETLKPVAAFSRTTADSDWLGEVAQQQVDTPRIVAQAARWFNQLSPEVRADDEEYTEQAFGCARRLASSYGPRAPEVERTFLDYASFLRTQSASGLDQIQQTVTPDGTTEKSTPLPPDVFDNFAPPVADINSGAVGSDSSERNPLLQEISGGGGNSSPEVPGGHSTNDAVSQGGQGGGDGSTAVHADGGGNSSPEVPGGHQGDDEPRRAEAASSLPQIQQTVDVHDNPAPTPLPTTVAFPWELGESNQDQLAGEAHYDQGTSVPAKHTTSALQMLADQWTQPHQTVQPNIANTPASTPPVGTGTAAQGRADGANPQAAPSYADATVDGAYTDAYSAAAPAPGPSDVPVSIGGDNGQAQHHPRFASRHVVSDEDMATPDFQRGYRYAARWRPGTPLVTIGSAELEAGLYAGVTDYPQHRAEWLDAHRRLAAKDVRLGRRIALHRQLTEIAASEQDLATDGTYLQAEASGTTFLDTTAPGTSPSPTGQTPINGPGQPGPLAGGTDPAAAGGPAPYNGTEPTGSPVVPSAAAGGGVTQTIPDTGMTTPRQSMPPAMATFRRTVQANLLAERTAR